MFLHELTIFVNLKFYLFDSINHLYFLLVIGTDDETTICARVTNDSVSSNSYANVF